MEHLKDIDAEKAILGSILSKNSLMDNLDISLADDFVRPAHSDIFSLCMRMRLEGKPVDIVVLADLLKRQNLLDRAGGVAGLSDILNSVASTAMLDNYVGIVKDYARRRRLIQSCQNAVQELLDGQTEESNVMDTLMSSISSEITGKDKAKVHVMQEALMQFIQDLQERKSTDIGARSGFAELDKMLGGLADGQLIIVAARPAMGKSAFAVNIAENICQKGGSCLVFALEMSCQQLLRRILASRTGVSFSALKASDTMTDKDWAQLIDRSDDLYEFKMGIVDDGEQTIESIKATCNKWIVQHGKLDLVVIDYLQLITINGFQNDRVRAISYATRALKQMARDLKVPIVLLSQLNRGVEARQNKRPMLADLRESGSIEQDADVVIFLYRDNYYRGVPIEEGKAEIAEVIIAKQREGATGTAEVAFIPSRTMFCNLARGDGR